MEYTELQNIAVEVTFERWAKFNGVYSDVHIGLFRNEKVAVKIIRSIGHTPPETMQRKLRRERELWVKLKHRNIVPFYGFAEDERFGPLGALISPWYENGDAAKFLSVYGKEMDVLARSRLWMGVIAGVHYLHTYSPVIVHGDLKPGNILIDNQRNARLCDFGLSRMLTAPGASGFTTTSAHTGTERYLSYELVVSEDTCPTTASDVYALACIGFEFIYLKPPYADRQKFFRRDIENGLPPAVRPSKLPGSRIPLWNVFESCWALEAASRPGVENVLAFHRRWHAPVTSFNDWREDDFSSMVHTLTYSIYQAMYNLYGLEEATIKADKWNFWRNHLRYAQVRANLKPQWEAITLLMNECCSYSGYVARLHENMASITREEARELLGEVSTKGSIVLDLAKTLSDGHDAVIQPYNRYRNQIMSSISQAEQNRGAQGLLDAMHHWFNDRPRFLWDVYVLRPSKHMVKPMSQLEHEVSSTIDLDGEKAMVRFERSTKNIRHLLEAITAFLDTQFATCNAYLITLQDPATPVRGKEIDEFANRWDVYEVNCRKAGSDIARASDAILAHPGL